MAAVCGPLDQSFESLWFLDGFLGRAGESGQGNVVSTQDLIQSVGSHVFWLLPSLSPSPGYQFCAHVLHFIDFLSRHSHG